MYTHFWDMNSGGGLKEEYDHIILPGDEETAIAAFIAKFGHDPRDVACQCCGANYAISSGADLLDLTEYHRRAFWDGVRYSGGQDLEAFAARADVLLITSEGP